MLDPRIKGSEFSRPDFAARSGLIIAKFSRQQLEIILYFDQSGYCIWSKKLEQGQFVVRGAPGGKRQLNWTQLKLLLDGIEIKKARQFKRYSHPS